MQETQVLHESRRKKDERERERKKQTKKTKVREGGVRCQVASLLLLPSCRESLFSLFPTWCARSLFRLFFPALLSSSYCSIFFCIRYETFNVSYRTSGALRMKIVVQEKEQKLTGATRTFEEEAVPLDSTTTYAKQLSLLYRFLFI